MTATSEIDPESGAEAGGRLWDSLQQQSDAEAEFIVAAPSTGHPAKVHDQFGGAEVAVFRRAFADWGRRLSADGRVFRLSANAFAWMSSDASPPSTFEYRGLRIDLWWRRVRLS